MKRYFFFISYDGCNYAGWQIQPDQISVQKVIEDKLSMLHGNTSVDVVGCGRTDSGVHASAFVFHVDLSLKLPLDTIKYKLNGMLPDDIAVHDVFEVEPSSHARFDAVERTYHYFIHQQKNPFLTNYSYYIKRNIDIDKMNEAAQFLIGRKDFTSFSKLHTDVKNNFCDLKSAKFERLKNGQIKFEITANRFLRNMVRATVGTLLEVGYGKITPEDVIEILNLKNRNDAGVSVPGHALFLAGINYPYYNTP